MFVWKIYKKVRDKSLPLPVVVEMAIDSKSSSRDVGTKESVGLRVDNDSSVSSYRSYFPFDLVMSYSPGIERKSCAH